MGIRKVSKKKARGLRGMTNWKQVISLTDDEVKFAAMLDPDARELRHDELVRFRRERKK